MSAYSRAYTERDGSVFTEYADFSIEYRDASHAYWMHHDDKRERVVNVTNALKVLDRPALLRWAEDCGAEGAARLAALGELKGIEMTDAGGLVRLHKLGMEAKRNAGADRGSAVHRALEAWAADGEPPSLSDFPPEVRGYVQGLCSWLLTADPKPTAVERLVGSLKHGYAGRLDMRADLDGRDCIIDLKTSPRARVYPEAHAQARAYAIADVECGSPEPDGIVIVAVGEDGTWTTAECEASAEDWLAILGCHRAMVRLRAAAKLSADIAGGTS